MPLHAYPQSSFTFIPNPAIATQPVQFTDQTTFNDGRPQNDPSHGWSWDFGDFGTDTIQNPSHTYTSNGNYTTNLTATDGEGYSCQSSQEVKVNRKSPEFIEVPPR